MVKKWKIVISLFFAFILAFITYCSVCLPSNLDTSRSGWLGAAVIEVVGPLVTPSPVATVVGVGNGGVVYYSFDGVNWKQKTIAPATVNLNTVVYTGSRYIAAGGSAGSCAIYTSTDGVIWSPETLPASCLDPITDLAFGGGLVIGVGGLNTFTTTPLVLTSSNDGKSWSASTIVGAPSALSKVAFDGTYFIAVDTTAAPQAYRRTVAGAFAAAPTLQPLGVVKPGCVAGALYTLPGTARVVIAGNECQSIDNVAISYFTADGATTWTLNGAPAIFNGNGVGVLTEIPRGLVMGGTRLVAVGDACRVDFSDTATTTLTWNVNGTMTGCPVGGAWSAVTYDGSKFIAVGANGAVGLMALSATGAQAGWTVVSTGVPVLNDIVAR